MADDYVELNPGTAGQKVAVDKVVVGPNTVDYQWVKFIWGDSDVINKLSDATGKRLPINVSESAVIGATSESVATGDTVTSGLNGLLKRLLQRITTLLSVLPTSLGSNGGFKVETISGVGLATLAAGDVPSGSVDTGNPVKMGSRAAAFGSAQVFANGQRANAPCNTHGVPFVLIGDPNIQTFYATYTGAVANAVLIPQAAGGKLLIHSVEVVAGADNWGNPQVWLWLGASSTPGYNEYVYMHPAIAPGTVDPRDNGGVRTCGADDADLRLTIVDPATGPFSGGISCFIRYTPIPA